MENYVEWIGYLASILIAISMFMKDITKLRVINTGGCVAFVVYGFMIGAYPVALVNGMIIFINLYYIYSEFRKSGRDTGDAE